MHDYFVSLMYRIGKPTDIMDKSNVDWFPTLELGHFKINTSTLQAASERAARTSQKIKNCGRQCQVVFGLPMGQRLLQSLL